MDTEGDLIEVEDTSDLIQAFRYGKKEYQVLKFLIETYIKEANSVMSEKLESENEDDVQVIEEVKEEDNPSNIASAFQVYSLSPPKIVEERVK